MNDCKSRFRVLVIVPTQGLRPEMLDAAVKSVAAQTRAADEVVVTRSEEPLHVRLNDAIAKSDCDAFIVLCDDDLLAPTFIEETMAVLERGNVDLVYTDCQFFGDSQGIWKTPAWTKANIDANTVPPVTALCTKAAWEKAGGFESVPFFDWDFWWRCLYSGANAWKIQRPLFLHRRHAGQDGAKYDWAECRSRTLARFDELRGAY